jgi:peptide deformylase
MRIIEYPHPTLRYVSRPLKRVDAELRRMVAEMFDLMYEAKGIGLAANQVDLPYRLFVVNLEGDPSAKDEEMVFINPVLSKHKGQAEQEEGCLSLPGLYAPVVRPEIVTVQAYNLAGELYHQEVSGMLARCIQHETDHLDGILFIDRLSESNFAEVRGDLEDFQERFEGMRSRGEVDDEPTWTARIIELENARC